MNAETVSEIMKNAARVHFVGIGGISMSSLAAITKNMGYNVSGSDRTESEITDRLASEGIDVKYFHAAENVNGASLVVYTAAVRKDNPELAEAERAGIPLCSRADYLGWLMSGCRERIGIAGTHGKSTVTSMISEIFMSAGLAPTVVSGAELSDMGGAYRIGGKEYFIFEACEYCDSFLSFSPTTAVITNIEYDHADYFKNMDQLRESFLKYSGYARRTIFCADDPESAELMKKCPGGTVSFGLGQNADYRADNIMYDSFGCAWFDIVRCGTKICCVKLMVPGRHNVLNAIAAAACAFSYGISPEAVREGLFGFRGAARRFEYLGETETGALVYDDYAHHPSEIKATLSAAKARGRRIVTVFQPHTYSRTAGLWDGFVNAFGDSDVTLFADIYAARETDDCGVSSKMLADAVGGIYLPSFEAIADWLKKNCTGNDLIMILGAGNIINLGAMIVDGTKK